ncbi:MAG TPA: sigma-70 family RNA polymerase sigma factor [Isosphaeraceae bacterium]|nr:sigma-70 family RNA polymerase sigma factor [Isosphaeraceae bacterium]
MSDAYLDELIERLNDGDQAAAERVFQAYEPYLRMAVSRQLSGALRSKLDSMDIVQAVWTDVLVGFRESGWRFADRGQLQAFLATLARNRLIDRRRHYRQALERERPLAESEPADLPASSQPRPSEIAQGRELWERMLELCPPAHRELLNLRRQGLPLAEIAARTGLHEGSVRRIIYDLAKRISSVQKTVVEEPDSAP